METHAAERYECNVKNCTYNGKNKDLLSRHKKNMHGPLKKCKNEGKGCKFTARTGNAYRSLKKHKNMCQYNK